MARPYSEDLRERAVAGLTLASTVRRSGSKQFGISASCVAKWNECSGDETGSVAPGQIGGHKKPFCPAAMRDWLRKRIRSGPILPCAG